MSSASKAANETQLNLLRIVAEKEGEQITLFTLSSLYVELKKETSQIQQNLTRRANGLEAELQAKQETILSVQRKSREEKVMIILLKN